MVNWGRYHPFRRNNWDYLVPTPLALNMFADLPLSIYLSLSSALSNPSLQVLLLVSWLITFTFSNLRIKPSLLTSFLLLLSPSLLLLPRLSIVWNMNIIFTSFGISALPSVFSFLSSGSTMVSDLPLPAVGVLSILLELIAVLRLVPFWLCKSSLLLCGSVLLLWVPTVEFVIRKSSLLNLTSNNLLWCPYFQDVLRFMLLRLYFITTRKAIPSQYQSTFSCLRQHF